MKQFLPVLVILCFFSAALFAQTPVAHYPFNGNANDAVGTNHGTVSGATLTTDRNGNANSAYSFNGAGNHINLGSSAILKPTAALTVSAWFNFTNAATGISGETIISCTENQGYGIFYVKAVNQLVFYVFRNGIFADAAADASLCLTGWHHIAGTFDGRYMRLYIDGQLKDTDDAGANYPILYDNLTDLAIGADLNTGNVLNPSYHWNGKIDEVKIYATALTPTQILAEYYSSPVVYYPFNGNANDAMGALNGTVSGAANSTDRFGNAATAYSFDGVNDYIELGGNSNIVRPTTALTVSMWFKLENTGGTMGGRVLISNTECNTGYEIWWNKQGNMISGLLSRNGSYANVEYPATAYLSGWHFVTLTFDGRYTKLYLDGELKATNDAGANYPISYCSQAINYIGTESGNNAPDPAWHWYGQIDEVKIYNTALSAPEVFAEYINSKKVNKPGSGNALSLNGNNHVEIPDADGLNDFETNQDFTLECWVKIPSGSQPNPGVGGNYIIDKTGIGDANASYNLVMNNQLFPQYDGMVFIQRYDGVNQPGLRCTTRINDNKWHHIAATRTGGNTGVLSIYIDGVLEGTLADNTTGSTSNSAPVFIGSRYGNFSRLMGTIDEVRIWNIGLTQTQIRERMCRKISSSDVLFTNLSAYYNFDETAGNTAFDGTVNNNTGVHINSPLIQTSGAPIGNTSAFDYAATPNSTLVHPQGESLQAAVTSGSPNGIHVYSVNEAPNTVNGTSGTGNNDRYFGVFVAGGILPQYTATYNYTGNPNVTPANETNLLLYKRDNNAAAVWTDCGATLNTTANTLTATGQNTEYLLGGGFTALPITLLRFEALKQGSGSLLTWLTSFELNNEGFEVQHSKNGTQFTTIGFVKSAGNGNTETNYSFVHTQPVKGINYYRLLQKDMDGRQSSSDIKQVNFTDAVNISIYPNPATTTLTVQLAFTADRIKLLDASGKILWQQSNVTAGTHTITLQQYPAGVLLLQVTGKQGLVTNYKIVKL